MIIYSVMPPDFLLAGLENAVNNAEEIINGVTVQVQAVNENTAQINRIISTNPKDFMNPNLQPGKRISYRAEISKTMTPLG